MTIIKRLGNITPNIHLMLYVTMLYVITLMIKLGICIERIKY